MSETPKGVLCIITGPNGLVFTGTCFEKCPAAGFNDLLWQKGEARNEAYRTLWRSSVPPWLKEVPSSYDLETLVDRLLRQPGWKVHTESIGYPEDVSRCT